ncbi:MAG: hypothetical protein KAH95_12905, partial [Spirochaetales bacterium]|nr:hypothetical protein [Spirochaetales bacterium]
LIAVLAKNKIEAMAMGKVTGVLFIAPFIGWFAPAPWKFSAGILPPFWVSESYFDIMSGGKLFPVYIVVGLLVHGSFIYLLLKRYNFRTS